MALPLFTYTETSVCDPPPDVYCENIKRWIVERSEAAFVEVEKERNITLPRFTNNDVHIGLYGDADGRAIFILIAEGEEQPNNAREELFDIEIIVRTGTDKSPGEQKKRANCYNLILKRIIRQVVMEGHESELSYGWPHADDPKKDRKVPPKISLESISAFPVTASEEKKFGYNGGVRIKMRVLYFLLQ